MFFLRIEDFNFTDVFYVLKTLTSLMFLRMEDFNFTDVFTYGRL